MVRFRRRKQVSYINSYVWNLEKLVLMTFLQERSRDIDIENVLADASGEGEGGTGGENSVDIYMHHRV